VKITRKGYYTITGPDGVLLEREAGKVLQVTSRDECYEWITEDEREGVYTIHAPQREVLRTNLSHSQILSEETGLNPTISQIPNIGLNVGQTHNMGQYINDPDNRMIDSQILNLSPVVASYSHSTKLLTAIMAGVAPNLELEVTF